MNTSAYIEGLYQLNNQVTNVSNTYRKLLNYLKAQFSDNHFTEQEAYNVLSRIYKKPKTIRETFRQFYNSSYIVRCKTPLEGNFITDKNLLASYAQRFALCPSEFNLRNSCYGRIACCECSKKTNIIIEVLMKILKNSTIIESYEVKY